MGSDKDSHQEATSDTSCDVASVHVFIWTYLRHLFAASAAVEYIHRHFCCALHRLGLHLELSDSKSRRTFFQINEKMEDVEILL